MSVVDSIPFPLIKEMIAWRDQPSFATILNKAAKDKLMTSTGVSQNTINKFFEHALDPEAPRVSKRSEDKIFKSLKQFVLKNLSPLNERPEEWETVIVSQEGLFHVSTLWGMSLASNHPTSYAACVLCELFEEDAAILNSAYVASTRHNESLITQNELPKGLDKNSSRLIRRVDCAFYLMATQHAEQCNLIPPDAGFNSDQFIELYKTPYERGVLQERYFEILRDLTKKKRFSVLRVRPKDEQVVRANEYHESSSKRQINAWKNRDGKSTASAESIANIFEYSIGIQRREGDIEIYSEGHRFMTTMRRILNQLEEETNIECANLLLDRYQSYFHHHQKTLGSWEPRSPFLNESA